MNEEEFQKLKMSCELYKNKVDRLEKMTEIQEQRISELEKRSEKTDFQYEQIMKTLDKLNETTIPALSQEISALKNKPSERYNTIVTALITTIIGGIMGFLISRFFS